MDHTTTLVSFAQSFLEQYFSGNSGSWTNFLHQDCVWMDSTAQTLIGADNIRQYFSKKNTTAHMLQCSLSPLKLDAFNTLVFGKILIQAEEKKPPVNASVTLVCRDVNGFPKIAYHHLSPDHACQISIPDGNVCTSAFKASANSPIPLKCGRQLLYVAPDNIIYIQSREHRTCVHCLDKVFDCSMPITEIAKTLPDNFYMVRRGCMINTSCVTALKRCGVTLSNGTVIRIPAANYTRVKEELNHRITTHQPL